MSSLKEIFQLYGAGYLREYCEDILPSHRRVMRDILCCRSGEFGGHTFYCEDCDSYHYAYHSCRNRHCPQCQHKRADGWLAQQTQKLLPVEYFMATFTLPEGLRGVVRSHQKQLYHLFFQASAESLKALAADRRHLGGQLGMVGVLQTWARTLTYHPHIHYLIPGLGISVDGERLRFAREGFLMHAAPLSQIFRGKFRDGMRKAGLYEQVPAEVWDQNWVIDIRSVGRGEAALKYLAAYLYRIAISHKNILSCEEGRVAFRYKDRDSGAYKTIRLAANEFIRRFLQHVLPKGFQKVRYFGFLSTQQRYLLDQIRLLLRARCQPIQEPPIPRDPVFNCPNCGKAMVLIKPGIRKRAPPLAEILAKNGVQQSVFTQCSIPS